MKHVVLYFGSFNPIHRGHIALAEWVAEHVGCDEVVLVVSPKNPLKADDSLAPELNRFEMAELACARSRFPERIKPSVIEFLLEKPSYTIDTLRYLSRNYGGQMRFSVLLGADLVPQLERWRDYRELLDGYPLLVYPRRGFETTQYLDRITLLNEAPLCDFSSTEVRRALEHFRRPSGRLVLIAAGKAAWQMAKAAYDVLGKDVSCGAVITKYDHVKGAIGTLELFEAGQVAFQYADAEGVPTGRTPCL